MNYPTHLQKIPTRRQQQNRFDGLDRTLACPETAFCQMTNLTSDHHPYLSPRDPRSTFPAGENATALIAKDALCWVKGDSFYINGYPIPMDLTPGRKQLVSMGAWVVIFPDKKRVNTADQTWENLEATYTTTATVSFTPCTLTGESHALVKSPQPPDDTTLWWLDTGSSPVALKLYSTASESWVDLATPYTRITAPGIGSAFRRQDGVTLSGVQPADLAHLNGSHPIWELGEDHLVVTGLCGGDFSQEGGLTVQRCVPDMDFVVESKNRLWGCKYGISQGKLVNEIYASKLGDPTNWNCFMGISTGSQVISCGTDGPWTGAAALDSPLFFKEDRLHRVYGSGYPFGVTDIACHGVQRRCHRSLAVVGDTLFYKSPNGVMAYDGSLPVSVSDVLGDLSCTEATGGSLGDKYYLSLAGDDPQLLVYHRRRGLWHREDDLVITDFCPCDGKLYALSGTTVHILAGAPGSEPVRWSATTAPLTAGDPAQKYLARLTLRLQMATGSRLRLFLRYDSAGVWEQVAYLVGSRSQSFSLPITCRRCDHLQLKLEGEGSTRLLCLTKTWEEGSECVCS